VGVKAGYFEVGVATTRALVRLVDASRCRGRVAVANNNFAAG
jgi:hypothetical protein